ncbi:MAG: hypothetical protein QM680_14145 [Luteolibacter sp.]
MKRPWLFVISMFLLLILAWSSLIFVAVRHSPEQIQVNVVKSH